MSIYYHEQLYRTPEVLRRISSLPVAICGAGAVGANMAESLARSGFRTLRIVDRDRVEERNLSTQPYERDDIGAFKAVTLGHRLYRAVGVEVDARAADITAETVGRLLGGSGLVVDALDNSMGRGVVRAWCAEAGVACLHVGLAADYAEVIWNDVYRVPSAAQDDVCDYPLARNLVTLAVSVACEVVTAFAADGTRRSFTVTLRDFAVRQY